MAYCVVFAGFETGSVYALWAGQDHETDAPLLFYGYTSAVLLAVALIPQFWYIYKLKEVIGISMAFMAVDILGGVFSFLSLFFRPDLDVAAFVSALVRRKGHSQLIPGRYLMLWSWRWTVSSSS